MSVRPSLEDTNNDVQPLFDAILKKIPPPPGNADGPLQLLVSAIDYNDYVGRLGIGRIQRGRIRQSEDVVLILRDGTPKKGRVSKLTIFEGLKREEVEEAAAGEIVAVAGFENVEIGETFADAVTPEALVPIAIDEPSRMRMRGSSRSFIVESGSRLSPPVSGRAPPAASSR